MVNICRTVVWQLTGGLWPAIGYWSRFTKDQKLARHDRVYEEEETYQSHNRFILYGFIIEIGPVIYAKSEK
jgi:hypothetical protein